MRFLLTAEIAFDATDDDSIGRENLRRSEVKRAEIPHLSEVKSHINPN